MRWFLRRRYVRAMLRAIDAAAGRPDPGPWVNSCSRASGLRVIRDFEQVNGCDFDPFRAGHVLRVSNMARFRNILRARQR